MRMKDKDNWWEKNCPCFLLRKFHTSPKRPEFIEKIILNKIIKIGKNIGILSKMEGGF